MNNNKYKIFNKFVLRNPLLSLNFLQSIFQSENTSDKKLKEICTNLVIQEAIFLASPVLHSQLLKWLNNELSNTKDINRLKESITKYILRMGSRCTPFGLFAGYSLGNLDNTNSIELSETKEHYGHLRLDMNYLCALATDLAKVPEIKKQLRYYPNTSIYRSGDKLRYVEYRYINSKRNHFVIAVDNSVYLEQILGAANGGAKLTDLVELLIDHEIPAEDAVSFIDELIESQLLVSALEPSVTGDEFLIQIIDTLKPLNNIDEIIQFLEEIENDLIAIRNQNIGISSDEYMKLVDKLSKFDTKYDLKYLFQADLAMSHKSIELKSDIATDVLNGIGIMNRLTPKGINETLSKFKEAFYERYEEREVPLLEALDVESGVGYMQYMGSGDINPLIDDISLPSISKESSYNLKWNALQSFLFKKMNECLASGINEIVITDEDVKDFDISWEDLPSTFNAMVEILEIDSEGNSIISFGSAGGSSSVNLLGRFCHSNKDLFDYVQEITQKEENIHKDAILAEIVHLPESRTGNILSRPTLRDYEIPYMAKSSVSKVNQVSIDDLLVSVKLGRKIVLRSKTLNKEILPRLGNAHNFSYNALPVYQFLCDLQTQDVRGGVGFNLGALSNEYNFLPRVKYKNIILSKAFWNFKSKDINELVASSNDESIVVEAKKWKAKFNLPDYVLLADGDNELLLHLNNLLCLKTFIGLVKKRSNFKLKEFLFDGSKAIVKRGSDGFTNQVVFSFYKSELN
ncbi:MAG: lantibiotic dehydratase family protein [Thiohalospira sp.]